VHRTSTIAAALGVGVAVLATTAPAHAAVDRGSWLMNDQVPPSGQRGVMDDATANNNNGAVGTRVSMRVPYGSSYGYEFRGSGDVRNRENVVLVNDSSTLDPGTRNVTLSVEVTTTDSNANIMQKGQAGTPGGYYKVEINSGRPGCQFYGTNKEKNYTWPTAINNGRPHTIVCKKYGSYITITVDGVTSKPQYTAGAASIGSISNAKQLVIGGKAECGSGVSCDYFAGKVGSARVTFD